MAGKKRLDVLLTERGLAESRQKAQAIIMAEQIGEGVHGDGVAAGIAVTQRVMLREGEEAAHIPCAHP